MITISSFLRGLLVLIRSSSYVIVVVFITVLVVCCGCMVIAADGQQDKHPLARHLELSNESGEHLQIEWVHPITGEIVPYGVSEPNLPNHHFTLDSFVNHTFIVRTIINKNSNTSSKNDNSTVTEANMRSTRLVVGDQEKQHFVVTRDLVLDIVNDDQSFNQSSILNTIPNDMLPASPNENTLPKDDTAYIINKCRTNYNSEHGKESSSDDIMNQLVECFRNETASVLIIKNEYLAFQRNLLRKVANQAENYTCADPNLKTSKPIEVRTWTNNGFIHEVGVLHNHPSSQIHIVHDFISQSECDAIQKAAQPILHRGTVADGKGGSKLSEHRKAWQAGLKIKKWDDLNDPIAAVKRRLFAYANFVTGYNMSLNGQEDIMSIQYYGSGNYNDTTPDRYSPHCDGDCTGKIHKDGGRVATFVMYCDIPNTGGGTNFQNANVYVKPTRYSGVFFSYMNPITYIQDDGFTTHSGCPVYEGTKRIAVQWMRVGVTNENPWNSFDTNTISLNSKKEEVGVDI